MSVTVFLFFVLLIADIGEGKRYFAVRALTVCMFSRFSLTQESTIIFDHQMPFRALQSCQKKR